MSWLHALMLATAALDHGDRPVAQEHVARSLSLKPSWAGYRLQALLSADTEAASEAYRRAWEMGDAPPELAVEIAQHFMSARLSDQLKAFVDALPRAIRDNERIILARAVVAADDGAFDELERLLLDRPFATIREGETLLSDLWVRLRRGRLEAQLGRTATVDEVRADLKAHPVPRALNLRIHEIET
jgi:predicted transcriptional regulator